MARKSQTNTSRSKPTTRTNSSSATASSSKRQPATAKEKPETGASKANSSAQPTAPIAPEEQSITSQPLPPQTNHSTDGIGELQQQIAVLKEQFEQVQSNYKALQQTATEQAKAIDALQGQLDQRKSEQLNQHDQYHALQLKTIEQAQTIEQLQAQIATIDQQVEQRLSEQLAQLQSDATAYQTTSNTINADALNSVNQEVAGLKSEVNHQVMQQMTQQQRYEILRRQCDEQSQLIAELRNLVTQEQRYAAIGEAHLNKWRYRTFSS